MTCTARRCSTVLLEGYRKKEVIIAGAAEWGKGIREVYGDQNKDIKP